MNPGFFSRIHALQFLLLILIQGCDWMPQDPEDTFERVREGTLRVGVIQREPWTRVKAETAYGVDAALVRKVADLMDAEIEWVIGPEQELFEALKRFQLAVVVGGLSRDSPWRKHVAFTQPYLKTRIVVGAPPGWRAIGEIDGLKVAVPKGSALAAMVEEQDGVPVEIEEELLRTYEGLIAGPHWQLVGRGRVSTGVQLAEQQHVWAVPPGENRWLVFVERFLNRQRGEVEGMLREESKQR